MLSPDQTFGNFKIERKLGEGGMGTVYLARDAKLDRLVALKVLNPGAFDDSERRQRFHREARTAAQVSHPNVMGIIDVDEAVLPDGEDKQLYIVMEYISGESLKHVLTQSRLDTGKMLRYAEKTASGLAAAHHKNIVHRDIKAENIIIDENDEPRILDFGLAKPVDPVHFDGDGETDTVSEELTKAGKILGTIKYMSPEQVRGERTDSRSDVFSFGVLLYEMATGELPFAGSTQVSTLAKILESEPDAPHLKNAGIPAELERIINKCLCKDASDRYQDTRDLVVDLRQLRKQHDSGITETVSISGPVPRQEGMGTKDRSLKINLSWKVVILALVSLVVVSGLIEQCIEKDVPIQADRSGREIDRAVREGLRLANRLKSGNTIAVLQFVNNTGSDDLAWMETGLPEIMLTGLAQANAITVISPNRILGHLGVRHYEDTDREEYAAAASELGAAKLLSGSIFKAGERLRIESRLEDIESGTILLGERVTGDDPFELVDSLTYKIAASLDASGDMEGGAGAATFASSPGAYKEYHLGMEYYNEARWDEAVDQFNRAIAVDSAFALPYMRIGMVRIFQGRQQEGTQYIELADRHKDKLPRRERALLGVFSDIWQRRRLEGALEDLKRLVDQYPEFGEARVFYGLLVGSFERDTAASLAHLDTAVMLNPDDAFALQELINLKAEYGQTDEAIELAEHLREAYPEAPISYNTLSNMYLRRNKPDRAAEVLEEMRALYPEDPALLSNLSTVYIRSREFDKSRDALESLRRAHGDESFYLATYFRAMANLENWRGRFEASLTFRRRAMEEFRKANDTTGLYQATFSLAEQFHRLKRPDSAVFYHDRAYEIAGALQRVNYGLSLIEIQPERAGELRPVFRADLQDFKSRIPQQLIGLADAVDRLFEAFARADTADLIVAHDQLRQNAANPTTFERDLGWYLIMAGRFDEGLGWLLPQINSSDETTAAWTNLVTRYYIGCAYEGLGDEGKAIEHFRYMLRFWGDADVRIDEIKDAEARLARLTS